MSLPASSRQRPFPTEFEIRYWRWELWNHLLSFGPFANGVAQLRAEWIECGRPGTDESLHDADDPTVVWSLSSLWRDLDWRGLQREGVEIFPADYIQLIDAFLIRFGLTLSGKPASWAWQGVQDLIEGWEVFVVQHRPDMRFTIYWERKVELRVAPYGADVTIINDRNQLSGSDPRNIETIATEHVFPELDFRFNQWEEFEVAAATAAVDAVRALRDEYHVAYPANRRQVPERDRAIHVERLALQLTGRHSSRINRETRRRLCSLLQIDVPRNVKLSAQ